MIGDLTATLHADQLDMARGQLGRVGENVALIRVSPEREDRRMLEDQELVRDLVIGPRCGQLVLEIPGRAVVDAAEPADFDGPAGGPLGLRYTRVSTRLELGHDVGPDGGESVVVHRFHDSRASSPGRSARPEFNRRGAPRAP